MCPINYDAIPDKNPSGPIDAGVYRAKIVSAKMTQPKDVQKKQFLEVKMSLTGLNGKTGTFTDKHYESDSEYVLFKLKRFTQALSLPLHGIVELRDICKVVANGGQELVVVVAHQKKTFNGQERIEAQVDIFNSDAYYPLTEWARFQSEAGIEVSADTTEPTTEPAEPTADTAATTNQY